MIDDALTAHLLAVIGARALEGIAGGSLSRSPSLDAVLDHARRARDAAIARVAAEDARAYDEVEPEALEAMAEQRRIFKAARGIDLARYVALTRAKRRVGVPAALALALAAGWEPRRRRSLARALDDVALGQALHDDVARWEGDDARGGAWAVALIGGAASLAQGEGGATLRGQVLASGVLARLLVASARRFGAARRRAAALGASRLAAWAAEREATLRDLAQREAASPGFTGRGRALSAWAHQAKG